MTIKYGDKRAPSKSAYSSGYDDPGQTRYEASHGGVKEVLDALLKDLGSSASSLDEIAIVKLLVGDGVDDILDDEIEGLSLRKVIMETLEH
ncbi:hypothetical protein PILCRDRAFT_810886 [Piloderma croceum F 1598]|uniref:Uncharacterized protein n=1 Tax=Piloderma croceum (strain F 1598) TaxID=765440 RepID=A0A0C3GJ03_PILCF|nr:hypothetical protein PILCRDRAFT_810886 [Piloderma croceum F 1598]